MTAMKKTKLKNAPSSNYQKGQKLPYEKLRTTILDTIQRHKIQDWSARQLIKKLKLRMAKMMSPGCLILWSNRENFFQMNKVSTPL